MYQESGWSKNMHGWSASLINAPYGAYLDHCYAWNLQIHFLRVFVANLKNDAIYAFYLESFCDSNLAIRKVFAFSDSGNRAPATTCSVSLSIFYNCNWSNGSFSLFLSSFKEMDEVRTASFGKKHLQRAREEEIEPPSYTDLWFSVGIHTLWQSIKHQSWCLPFVSQI